LDPAGRLEEREQYSDLYQAVLELGENHRAVVVLRHFVQCSYSEVAGMLDIPEKTVKSRLFEARQILRRTLSARGHVRRQ
jgi:RNA polymerase sigma-70 factor (ECF subfamily)